MPKNIEELKSMLKFDKHGLDEEFLSFPMQFREIGQQSVMAFNERDRMKQRLDVKRAELDSLIRRKPESYGIDKISENAISNVIICNKQYQALYDEFLKCKEEADVLEVLKDAMRMKLTAMTYSVKLYESSYFADGKMPRVAKEGRDAAVQEKQRQGLSQSTRLRR